MLAQQSSVSQQSAASSIPHSGRPYYSSQGLRPPLAGSSSSAVPGPRPETMPARTPGNGGTQTGRQGASSSRMRESGRGRASALVSSREDEAAQSLVFDRMYEHLMREEAGFVGELERFLDLHEQVRRSHPINPHPHANTTRERFLHLHTSR